MQADAYRRARKLLSSRREYVIARVLGFVQSLLIVALLGVIALFVARPVVAGRGAVSGVQGTACLPPVGHQSLRPAKISKYLLFDDTGIFPLIADNLQSRNPVHRAGASILGRIDSVLRRRCAYNRRRADDAACARVDLHRADRARGDSGGVASSPRSRPTLRPSLRRQIHRQMYRLGQSSLPTEGIGPVINLWTREVNDIRDGLIADLDLTPRIHVLAVGLLVIALLVSPLLTAFLASLGLFVWLTARVLNRDARQATEAALRDASVQLCLLHEDLGLLRTVRTYGVGDYRPPTVRRTPGSLSPRPTRGGSSPAPRSTRAPGCFMEPP